MTFLWPRMSAEPASTSIVAIVTTLHCALVVVRRYRPVMGGNLVLIPSILFTALPWILSSYSWLLIVLAAHLAWFLTCERLPVRAVQPPVAAASRSTAFRARVLAVHQLTPEVKLFRFERPPRFTFTPGQFLMLRQNVGGRAMVRCYSIITTPATTRYLEIAVRRQGEFSDHLHATLAAGAEVDFSGPGGAFVYPDGVEPLVLIAAGIGITPLLSMLRHALEHDRAREVTLLYSARSADQMPFLEELRQLSERHPRFRFVPTLSGATSPSGAASAAFAKGRVDAALVRSACSDVRGSIHLICGPAAMIDDVRRFLADGRVPEENVRYEKFEVAVSQANAAAGGGPFAVTLVGCNRQLSAASGQTLLEALEGAGETFPSMCRVGVCATCRVRVAVGSVAGDFEALGEREREQGWVLACVGRPTSDCRLEA